MRRTALAGLIGLFLSATLLTLPPAAAAVSVPAAPGNPTAVALSTSEIRITWTEHSDQTGFLVSDYMENRQVGPDVRSYVWGGLSPGEWKCFKVQAFNADGYSDWSDIQWGQVCTTSLPLPPAVPTIVNNTALSSSEILVRWTENSNQTGIEITDGSKTIDVGDHDSYTWTGLAPNTYKCSRVRAYNAGGHSAWSRPACATTLPSAPAVPRSVRALALSTSEIRITWTENSNPTNFLVSDGVTDVVVSGYARSYIWPGLAPNTLKCFTVTARNASGQSPRSDQACTSTLRWPERYQIRLRVPYLSQYQEDPKIGSPIDRVDCGPTAAAMVLQYLGKRPATVRRDVDWVLQVRARTKVSDTACPKSRTQPTGGPCDTTAPQLEAALTSYGVTYSEVSRVLKPAPDSQLVAIHAALASGKPVIALVHGYDLGRGAKNKGDPGYYGDHWIVVTGFTADGQYAFVNDPDNEPANGARWIKGGAQIKVPTSTLGTAMMDTEDGPFYGIIVN